MKYNWAKLPEFVNLYENLNKTIREGHYDERLVNLFMVSFEEFFFSAIKLKYIDASNFDLVIDRLSRIKSVGSLHTHYNNRMSLSFKDKDQRKIFFNSDLTDDELKFHIYKELSRVASSIDPLVTRRITNEYLFDKDISNLSLNIKDRYIEMGFRLVEEGMCIDMAENIYSFNKNITRPSKTAKSEADIYGKKVIFLSNFTYCPSYQYLTSAVARKIVRCNEELSDDKLLYKLCKISLKSNFSENLFLSLKEAYGKKAYDILSSLGVIYKKEIDQRRECININPYLRVTDVKRAYKYAEDLLTKKYCKVG